MEKHPRIRTWLALLILLAAVGFLLQEALFPPSPAFVLSRESGDIASLYYYWRDFGFGSLRDGIIPLWNPFVFCGSPFAAYPEAAVFYPLNLVFLFLPLAAALNASLLIHLGLLALATYLWLRFTGSGRLPALMGALALTGSGPVILHLAAGHLSNLCTLAWVPLAFLLAEGLVRSGRLRWAAGLGVLGALQILAGHWQYVYYTGLGIALYLVGRALAGERAEGRRRLLIPGAILAGMAALGLGAVQILPARELAAESFRAGMDLQWAGAFSLPPANLTTFILPGWLGDSLTSLYRGENYFWEMCAYLGLVPLILAGIAIIIRRDRLTILAALLAGVAILVALGDATPLFRILHAFLPGFRYFRGHAKLLFFAAFFLSTLAARGADCLTARPGTAGEVKLRFSDRRRRKLAGAGALLLIGTGVAALLTTALAPPRPPGWWLNRLEGDLLDGRHYEIAPPNRDEGWERILRETPPDRDYPGYVRQLIGETPFPENSWRTLRSGLVRLGVAVGGLGILLAAARLFGRQRPWWAAAACLLAAGETMLWARTYVTGFDSRVCLWDGELQAFFERQEEPFRYLPFDPADFNRGMTGGVPSILGYQADVPRRALEYLNRSQGIGPGNLELVPLVSIYSPLLDLLNTRFLLLPPGTPPAREPFRSVLSAPGGEILENQAAQPRVLVSGRAEVVFPPEKILDRLSRPGYQPGEEVFLEEEIPARFTEAGREQPGTARVIAREPNRVRVRAELSRPGILLLNDSFHPGWKAYLQDREIPVYRANYLMRAVLLETGTHEVEFLYRPFSFYLGAAVSLATLFALSVGWLIRQRRAGAATRIRERSGDLP